MEDPFDYFDVSLLSYEEWVDYFFGQRLLREGEFFRDAFCPQGTVLRIKHPERIVDYLTQLFDGFSAIGRKHSLEQINQGLWAIIGPTFTLQESIWDDDVPIASRLACIHSMYRPFADYLKDHPAEMMENCFHMWFDMVPQSFWSYGLRGISYDQLTPEQRSLLDALFETLCAILDLNDERCQNAALHGLGHLRHPNGPARVQAFIDAHRGEDLNLEWLIECRDGTVM